jgi:hypothetical protein
VRRNEDTLFSPNDRSGGTTVLIDKLAGNTVESLEGSLHPADYDTKFSASEVDNLVAHLLTLTGRDTARTAIVPPAARRCDHQRLLNARRSLTIG